VLADKDAIKLRYWGPASELVMKKAEAKEMFKRIATLLAVLGAAVTMAAGSAAASTGPAKHSPAEAGYAATGARFKEAEINVRLPDASRFASEIGRLSFSVQLWAADTVVDVRVSACTDTTCRPGGKPAIRRYHLALRVFSRSTGTLICTTSNMTCPNVPGSWNHARFAHGRTVNLSIFYDHTNGFLSSQVNDKSYSNYSPGPGLAFHQARIGVELGATPWSTAPFRAPEAAVRLARLGVPSAPPAEAEIATYNGHGSCFTSWWAHHRVKMTSNGSSGGAVEAGPHHLSNHGCNFSVYLEP
jgi:hypothetical protein